MRFTIGPWVYRVTVCAGALLNEGEAVGGVPHRRVILLSGDLLPRERLEVLLDQLRRLHVAHFGAMKPEAIVSFTADIMRQLMRQGGEPALMRLDADGTIDAGAVPHICSQPGRCECGKCGTMLNPSEIRNASPEPHPETATTVVRRAVDCDFCSHTMTWMEGTTPAGSPNGSIVAGPEYSRHITSA